MGRSVPESISEECVYANADILNGLASLATTYTGISIANTDSESRVKEERQERKSQLQVKKERELPKRRSDPISLTLRRQKLVALVSLT